MLYSIGGELVTIVVGQYIGPIFKGPAIHSCLADIKATVNGGREEYKYRKYKTNGIIQN